MLDRSCSACIVLRGVWRLFRQRYSKRWRARRPLHQHAAGESNCDRRQTATFSVVPRGRCLLRISGRKRRGHHRRYIFQLHDSGHDHLRQRRTVSRYGEQRCGRVTSNSATLTVNPGQPLQSVDVITYHYDNGRSGQNLNETILTPANVNLTQFGKKANSQWMAKSMPSRCIFRRLPSTGK